LPGAKVGLAPAPALRVQRVALRDLVEGQAFEAAEVAFAQAQLVLHRQPGLCRHRLRRGVGALQVAAVDGVQPSSASAAPAAPPASARVSLSAMSVWPWMRSCGVPGRFAVAHGEHAGAAVLRNGHTPQTTASPAASQRARASAASATPAGAGRPLRGRSLVGVVGASRGDGVGLGQGLLDQPPRLGHVAVSMMPLVAGSRPSRRSSWSPLGPSMITSPVALLLNL
jgi:hypothetical protein